MKNLAIKLSEYAFKALLIGGVIGFILLLRKIVMSAELYGNL